MELIRRENTIFVLLIVLISSHLTHQPVITNTSMLLLGLAGLLSKNMLSSLLSAVKHPLFWSSITFFLVYAFSLLYSDNMTEGTRAITAKLPLLIFPLIFAMVPNSRGLTIKIIRSYPFILLTTLLIALIIQYSKVLNSDDISLIYNDNLGSPYGIQAVYAGLFINIALIFCFYLIAQTEKVRIKILYILIGISLYSFHFLLISRIAFLIATAILFLGSLLILLRNKPKAIKVTVGIVLVTSPIMAILSSEKLQNRFKSILNTEYRFDNPNPLNHFNAEQSDDNWNSVTARLATWVCAKDLFLKSPLVGHGVGDHFDQLMLEYENKNYILGLNQKFNTHNQYFDIALACGLIGVMALLFYFVCPLIYGLQQKDYLIIAITILLMLNAFTENILNRSQGIILISVIFGLLLTRLKNLKND